MLPFGSGAKKKQRRLTPFAGKATLGYRLEEGKRAVTFRINDVSGVAGFILPGDKVDIMLTRRIPGQGSVTDMILQNITILGINQETNEERNKPLTPFAGKATLGYRLEEGKRAVTFRVNDVSGVAGFILPGDKVDIMLTRRIPGQGSVTDMILQNITVLGINQETNEERNKPLPGRTATVEATPEEAQKLSLAQRVGALSLALRNVSATSEVQPQRVVEADLFPPSKQPEEREDTVRVRRGIKVTVERMGL